MTVKDTGIGMKPSDIPKAMERFSQIDNSLSRRHEGTGLGLYLVKLFAALHQATITLESEVDVGTTATVRFPSERRLARA
jgi:signal transduction histidine kinase